MFQGQARLERTEPTEMFFGKYRLAQTSLSAFLAVTCRVSFFLIRFFIGKWESAKENQNFAASLT